MLQRIVLYATLGALLTHLGHVWDTWSFWSILALYWASEQISRREGYEAGMVFIATLPMEHLEKIKREIAKIEDNAKD
jgi:hypothetical protein